MGFYHTTKLIFTQLQTALEAMTKETKLYISATRVPRHITRLLYHMQQLCPPTLVVSTPSLSLVPHMKTLPRLDISRFRVFLARGNQLVHELEPSTTEYVQFPPSFTKSSLPDKISNESVDASPSIQRVYAAAWHHIFETICSVAISTPLDQLDIIKTVPTQEQTGSMHSLLSWRRHVMNLSLNGIQHRI